ncbi:integrator complex subunit 12-like [Atheta coriaria]|uniref:integrator complex subunit 12-like n=1 Tax=Dalotia coriaria TaxID=877792 RepID=UPI0031F3708B
MSALAELDASYLKSINALHSKDHLLNSKPSLQTYLEEAIKSKTGKDCNLTAMVQSLMRQSGVEMLSTAMDDAKATSTSDNELELDLLLKEDLACVICQGMDVGARNRLLECSDCHALYHQECHQPSVTQQEADNAWVCASCKEIRKAKKSPTHSSSSSSTHISSKPKSSSNSPRHPSDKGDRSEKGDRSSSSGYKSSSSKSGSKSGSSSSSGSKSSSSASKSSSSKHTPVTTSSSIVSADKRLQNMKKKAAKLHEKKKLPR